MKRWSDLIIKRIRYRLEEIKNSWSIPNGADGQDLDSSCKQSLFLWYIYTLYKAYLYLSLDMLRAKHIFMYCKKLDRVEKGDSHEIRAKSRHVMPRIWQFDVHS